MSLFKYGDFEIELDFTDADTLAAIEEAYEKMQEDIIYFFKEERDEDLGIIGSEMILDFFIEMLGERIYNKALDDVKLWLTRNVENLESDYYALYK